MTVKIPPVSLNVRTKILVLFVALALISLFITGAVALYTIGVFGESARHSSARLGLEAVQDSSAALHSTTESAMVRMAEDQALLIDEIFWSTELELNLLAAQAMSVQDNPGYLPQVPTFTEASPPALRYAGVLAWSAPSATVSQDSDEYRALAGMNDLLAAVYHSDGDLVSVYVATGSGLLRTYPYDSGIPRGFDPRQRDWYVMAASSQKPVWTEPYVDASGNGLVVTAARSAGTKYGPWVVASDVTIGQLGDYTNLTLGGKGYAVIIDERGTVISRPGLAADGTGPRAAYVPENIFSDNISGLAGVGADMTAQKTGVAQVLINKTPVFVAYAPITSLNWSYAVFLPVEEVTAPIRETEGKILAATRETDSLIENQTARVIGILSLLFIVTLVAVIVLSWFLARMITRPVEVLREGAAALGGGDLTSRVDIRSGDEFEDLGCSFNRMAEDLKTNIENLKKTTAEKERYSREMEIAKEIQDTFLPESAPDIPGYEIAAANFPAMEIGGDLYDFIPAGAGRMAFVIADVSGKGVSAALFMALSRTLLHAIGGEEGDPSRAVQTVNRLIFADDRSGMFITVFYGVLDPETGTFAYVNGGHNPPLIVHRDGTARWLDRAKGIALGVVEDVAIPAFTETLAAGDVILLYTDGVTEAFDEKEECFGEERVRDCLRRNRSLPAQEILSALLDEIRQFTGSAPQSDDITMVVICAR